MGIALREPMTLAEFLDWEERQELRYEFDGFQPVAMTGGTLRHEAIGGTLRALLHQRLRGGTCRPWGPITKIEVQGRIRYPDAVISCTPGSPGDTIVPQPVVVFEILSPGTSRTDRIEKLREYQATPSIQRYVILEQDSIAAMVLSRLGTAWMVTTLTGAEMLHMPEIGIELPLAEIYADADLEDDSAFAGSL
ncbi:MAG: Uma2 family endonuclease [Acetobacteraceae bacterium]